MNYKEFKKLLLKWNNDTAFMSFNTAKEKHKNKDIIINFAKQNENNKKLIISYALLNLGNTIHVTLILLHELIDKTPKIYEEFQGRMNAIEEIYQIWGDDNGYIKRGYSPKAYWTESCFDEDAKELDKEYKYWNNEDMENYKKSSYNLKIFKKEKLKQLFKKND